MKQKSDIAKLDKNFAPVEVLGSDNLGTVDGTHPTDVGFMRIARALESVVRKIISGAR